MTARPNVLFATALLACLVAACSAGDKKPVRENTMSIQFTSSAFAEGQPIPAKHTADGPDVSPPVQWTNIPPAAKSLALICDDPDAPVGTWVHWVVYDLASATAGLATDVPNSQYLSNGAKQGLNDFGRLGYGGPCPPPGKPHRYFFKLYALDTVLDLRPGATKKDVETAMKGHVLAEGRLMGTYQRR
jgi:Raf kinase inhibitor-like YbhB/YbcL family protein